MVANLLRRLWPVAALLAILPLSLAHAGDNEAGGAPLIGRPTDLPFSEGCGSFTVSARAEPTTVQVGQVVTLTVIVEADSPVRHPPERIDLAQVPDIAERFYIEAPDGDDAPSADGSRWEFVYRLKPRRPDVAEIPGVPFAFFNPSIRPENKAFQVKYTDAIPLQVTSAPLMPTKPRAVAEVFLQTHGGPALLARQTPWTPPGPLVLALLLGVPPLGCAAWYVVWRRLNSDTGRQKQRRRSRAARQALTRLEQAERAAVERRALLTAAAVADYLRERVDLTIAEPTPREAGTLLRRAGCAVEVVDQTVGFLQTCDAARFWPPVAADGARLPELARALILALDADTEAPRPPAVPAEEDLL